MTPTQLGFDEYDIATQILLSHHYWVVDGKLEIFSAPYRYVWPSELDLMARLAGMTLRERWSGWTPRAVHEREHDPRLGLGEVRVDASRHATGHPGSDRYLMLAAATLPTAVITSMPWSSAVPSSPTSTNRKDTKVLPFRNPSTSPRMRTRGTPGCRRP